MALDRLTEITSLARRNILLHGQLHIDDGGFEFVKLDTDKKLSSRSVRLEPKRFSEVIKRISDLMGELQFVLDISEECPPSALTGQIELIA